MDCSSSVYSWYERITCYLPYSSPLLHIFQSYFALFPSPPLLRCIIRLSQNHVTDFVQSIEAAGSMSSTFISLLNELMCSVPSVVDAKNLHRSRNESILSTSLMEDDFASIAWQFVAMCLEEKEDVFYASDLMVLIDIVTRAVKNESDSLPVAMNDWNEV